MKLLLDRPGQTFGGVPACVGKRGGQLLCSILRLGKFGRKNRGILLKSLDIGKLLGGLLPKSKDLRNTASIFFFELCDCLKPVLDLIELPGIEIQLFKLLARCV